jgi:hypothetical protein
MIIGHVGVSMGAAALDRRPKAARAPLSLLLAAAIAPDMVDGVLAAGRYCNPDGVYSHSLPAVAALALLFGVAAFLYSGRAATALLVAGLVALHLPPDYLTGLKPLWPDGPLLGLHFYRWPWLDLLVEAPVIVAGWWMLRRARYTPRWVVSGLALAALLALQVTFDARIVIAGPQPARQCGRR